MSRVNESQSNVLVLYELGYGIEILAGVGFHACLVLSLAYDARPRRQVDCRNGFGVTSVLHVYHGTNHGGGGNALA